MKQPQRGLLSFNLVIHNGVTVVGGKAMTMSQAQSVYTAFAIGAVIQTGKTADSYYIDIVMNNSSQGGA